MNVKFHIHGNPELYWCLLTHPSETYYFINPDKQKQSKNSKVNAEEMCRVAIRVASAANTDSLR